MAFKPTTEQTECIDKFKSGRRLRVNAYAGTGKTSTLTLMANADARVGTYMAFNKNIADEAKTKFPSSVACSTTHALAFRDVMQSKNNPNGYATDKMTGNCNGGFLAWKMRLNNREVGPDTKVTGRGWGFLLLDTIKRWQRSDRDEIGIRDVVLEGKLALLDPKWRDPLRQRIFREAAKLWERMADRNDEIPLGHDGYLKAWALKKPTIPGDYIFLDEAQDTNGVVLGIMRHQKAQVICVGDRHQCQPPGTMVRRATTLSTPHRAAEHEYVPIEEIREGDRLVSWSMDHSHFYLNGDPVEAVASRPYDGDLIVATAGNKVSRYTPSHRCIAKLANGFVGKHFVYLMRKGDAFRIGRATGVHESQGGRFGFMLRAAREGCDALWLLSAHGSAEEAALAEALTSHAYGIPGMLFRAADDRLASQAFVDTFWMRAGSLVERAVVALAEHGRDIAYPLWEKGEANLVARRATLIHACNLMDGMQLLNGDMIEGKGEREWIDATFSREAYCGQVYSLKVANRETYVADGLLTHNSIYEWRGAQNAMVELPADVEARLSTSWRFGPAISGYASEVLALLGETIPLKGNPGISDSLATVEAPDAILTRTNSRLLEELIGALERNRKPFVVGGVREMLTYIEAAEKLMANQPVEFPLDFFGFVNWREVQEAAEREDGAELRRWVRPIDQYGVDVLRSALESLPKQEKGADLILSTGHKSKGREWPKVKLCDDFLRGVRTEKENEDKAELSEPPAAPEEELRLYYVAATRAQQTLEVPAPLAEKMKILKEAALNRAAAE